MRGEILNVKIKMTIMVFDYYQNQKHEKSINTLNQFFYRNDSKHAKKYVAQLKIRTLESTNRWKRGSIANPKKCIIYLLSLKLYLYHENVKNDAKKNICPHPFFLTTI